MKFILPTAFMILLFASWPNFAADEVSNKGQAFTACKAAANEQFDGVQGVKMLSVRYHKKKYKIKLRVTSGEERIKKTCRVGRDGNVEFSDK
ncbi:MAG: hypothetical protein AB8B48_13440 [Pseudomonadales bacterium]